MITEWDVPFSLVTPAGTLALNQTNETTGWRFQLNPRRCNATLPVRVTEDDRPQADGKIPHRRWRSGYGAQLMVELLIGTDDCAGGNDLVQMTDLLGLHLNAMIRTGLVQGYPNARLIWTPTGEENRMLDRCQLASAPTPNLEGELGGTQVGFEIDTPYPYYMSEAEESVTVTGTSTLTNEGNTDTYAVMQLAGPTTYADIINNSVLDLDGDPLFLRYNADLPPGDTIDSGDYVEINFFTGIAYLNGFVANRKSQIDFRYTDFFPLVAGGNEVEVSPGHSVLVKYNHAWA